MVTGFYGRTAPRSKEIFLDLSYEQPLFKYFFEQLEWYCTIRSGIVKHIGRK